MYGLTQTTSTVSLQVQTIPPERLDLWAVSVVLLIAGFVVWAIE